MASPIKEAALKIGDRVWTGRRHGDAIIVAIRDIRGSIKGAVYGFVTEDGEFLDRQQAFERAVECGQIKNEGERALVSEMLY